MSAYDEMMQHAAEFKSAGYKITKPEENTMSAVARPVSAAINKSAGSILANDTTAPRSAARVPAYVPPAAARSTAVPIDPSDVEDLYSIGERDGKLWLKFSSVPKTVFVFAGVPAELIQGLRTSIDRDDYFRATSRTSFRLKL